MRNLLAFLVAVLIGGAIVFVLSRRRGGEAPRTAEQAGGAVAESGAPDRDPSQATSGAPPRDRTSPRPSDELAPPAPLPAALAGTIVVLDESDREHPAETGILALGLGIAGARTHLEVDVRDGRWILPIAAERNASIAVRACVLGDRSAAPAPGQAAELALPSDGRVALRMRWHAGPLLRVRARDTGRELEQVDLYELPQSQRGSTLDARHPGPAAQSTGRAAGPSPVRLGAGGLDALGARVFFAKSPGYAWGRIEIAPSAAEEQTLMLEPAGTLELAVMTDPQLSTLEILVREGAPPHAVVLDVQRGAAKTFVIADLPPGRYIAQARLYGMLAGTIEVDVPPGQRVKAALDVVPPPSATVPLEGVLVLPEEWELDDFMLEFLLQGPFDDGSLSRGSFEIRRSEMTLEKGSRDRYRWTAPDARAARYRIGLFPAPFATELDVGPSGSRDARIEVPPPCVVSVRCVDDKLGAEAWSKLLSFAALTPRATVAQTLTALAGSSSSSATREFRAPQGPVLILLTRPAPEGPIARLIEAGPGRNEVLLLGSRAAGARIDR